jgi:protease IV
MDYDNVTGRKPRRTGLIIFIIAVVVFLIGGILLIAGLSSLAKGSQPKVKPNSTLVLKLDKPIQESPGDPFAMQFFGAKVYQFAELHDALKRAKDDERIKSLLIVATYTPVSIAKAQELKADIEEFKKSKKPVYAYFEVTGNSGYYMASCADKIYAPPSSIMVMSGLYAEIPFFRDTLEKIKVQPQLYHIGDYKSYSDTFMRKDMSDAEREAMDAILDSLYNNMVGGICKNGRFTPDELKAIIDTGLQHGSYLKEKKIVDDLLYPDDVDEILKKVNGNKEKVSKIDMCDYIKDKRVVLDKLAKKSVAVVFASGEIVDDGGSRADNITPGKLNKLLDKAADDKDVSAIVMRVDSPGGSGLASDIIWNKIQQIRKKKPVVISMSSVAGSGGYYIAMGSDGIVAQPTTITGSIGVVTGKFVMKGIYDWAGVGMATMKRGQNADLFSAYQAFTPEQEKIIVGHMGQFYKDFVTKAAAGRNMSYDELHKVAQGRIWSGEDALKIGLVDRLGGLDEAIALAKEKSKIPAGEKVSIKYYPRQKTVFESIMEMSGEEMTEEITTALVKEMSPEIFAKIEEQTKIMGVFKNEPFALYTPEKVVVN